MKTRELAVLVIVAVFSAVATVAVSSALKPDNVEAAPQDLSAASSGVARWLRMTPEAAAVLAPLEAAYQADRAKLERALASERELLATLLESPATSDARLREQVERVVAADGALEQRTAEFLIDVRPLLGAEQQRKLFNRFADGVREAGGYRWRHGQGTEPNGQRGGGPPAGRGPGQGRGRSHGSAPSAPASQPGRP